MLLVFLRSDCEGLAACYWRRSSRTNPGTHPEAPRHRKRRSRRAASVYLVLSVNRWLHALEVVATQSVSSSHSWKMRMFVCWAWRLPVPVSSQGSTPRRSRPDLSAFFTARRRICCRIAMGRYRVDAFVLALALCLSSHPPACVPTVLYVVGGRDALDLGWPRLSGRRTAAFAPQEERPRRVRALYRC